MKLHVAPWTKQARGDGRDGNVLHSQQRVLNVGVSFSLKTNSFCSDRLMISTNMDNEKRRRIGNIDKGR